MATVTSMDGQKASPVATKGTQTRLLLSSGLIGPAVLIAFFFVWWIGANVVAATNPRASILLPSPVDVVQAIPRLAVFAGPGVEQGYANALLVIASNTLVSATTLLSGIVIGSSLGILVGLLLGWNTKLRMLAETPLLIVRTIPLLALLPLFLSWFGGTQTGAITFVAFAVFSMLFVNTLEAIRNVNPLLLVYAQTLGASRAHVYRTVVMPAIVPELIGGMRVVIGLAWAILLAAEFLAAQAGIGRILILAQQYLDTSRMILIVLLIMLYSYILDRVVIFVGRYLTRWVPRKV